MNKKEGQGQWHEYPGVNMIKCMIKDIGGGVWIGAVIYQGDYI